MEEEAEAEILLLKSEPCAQLHTRPAGVGNTSCFRVKNIAEIEYSQMNQVLNAERKEKAKTMQLERDSPELHAATFALCSCAAYGAARLPARLKRGERVQEVVSDPLVEDRADRRAGDQPRPLPVAKVFFSGLWYDFKGRGVPDGQPKGHERLPG